MEATRTQKESDTGCKLRGKGPRNHVWGEGEGCVAGVKHP